ncbi:MAG: heavy-metal-associated domain-containing protein [Rhizobacter sp.]|nr:heavy-metal-associated domain-containing protein [Rhizobacter sp.]
MQIFRVDDMSCSHCASTITKALKEADRGARVSINLGQHLVMVEPTEADTQALCDALREAGYTPVPVQAPAATATVTATATAG